MRALARAVGRAAESLAVTVAAVVIVAGAAVAVAVNGFGFGIAGALSLYFVVWWTVLFAILPLGVRSQAEAGEVVPGSDPGSPDAPRLRERAIWTTVAASIVFVATAILLPYAGV